LSWLNPNFETRQNYPKIPTTVLTHIRVEPAQPKTNKCGFSQLWYSWLNPKKLEKNGFWWTFRMGSGVLQVARGGSPPFAARPNSQNFPLHIKHDFTRVPKFSNESSRE